MITRVVSFVTLAAYLGCIFGCSSSMYITIDKAKKKYGLRKPRSGEIITAVMPSSGEEITFDSAGGIYNETTKTIDGFTPDNMAVTVALNDTRFIKVINSLEGESVTYTLQPWAFEGDWKRQYHEGITYVVLYSGEIVGFDKHGGRLCMREEVVTGKTKDDTPIEVRFEDVESIRISEINTTRRSRPDSCGKLEMA